MGIFMCVDGVNAVSCWISVG